MRIVKWGRFDMGRYEDIPSEERALAESIIIQEMRENDYHFNGHYHQRGEHGAPIFDNGKQYQATCRGWGAIMAKAYPDEVNDSDGMGYTEWAWDFVPHKEKYPE